MSKIMTIIGANLGNDARVTTTQNGAIVSFSLPVEFGGKDKKTQWVDHSYFMEKPESANKLAENLKKGVGLTVFGTLEENEYEGKEGKVKSLRVRADRIEFCSAKIAQAIFEGNLGADAEHREGGGTQFLELRVGVSPAKDETIWTKATAIGNYAKALLDGGKFVKGARVAVVSSLGFETYDSKDGVHTTSLAVTIDSVRVVAKQDSAAPAKSEEPVW